MSHICKGPSGPEKSIVTSQSTFLHAKMSEKNERLPFCAVTKSSLKEDLFSTFIFLEITPRIGG